MLFLSFLTSLSPLAFSRPICLFVGPVIHYSCRLNLMVFCYLFCQFFVALIIGFSFCLPGLPQMALNNTFCLPKNRRSLNPSLVEGFILYLSTISSTYLWDLGPKGILCLGHANVVSMLLSLVPGLFCLFLSLLSLSLSRLDFLQLLLQGNNMLLGGG